MIGHRILMTLAALLLSCASMMTLASVAAGQNAVLYEVTEQMKLKRRDTIRAATAVLMGSVSPGPSICPELLAETLPKKRCAIAVTASDKINLATGVGPVNGKFSILITGDNPVDGPELVIAEGSLHGEIDLSPVGAGIPLGFITADWSARGSRGGPLDGLRVEGTLIGTFRLPFLDPKRGVAYMLNPFTYPAAEDSAVAVRKAELSLGVPTVRLELDFIEDGTLRHFSVGK